MNDQNLCICGSGVIYENCCGLLHSGKKQAETAVELMRSRFTAFSMQNEDYLLESWDPKTRPVKVDFSKDIADWQRLEIVNTKKGGAKDRKGVVEFKAFYLLDGAEHVMNEVSRFHKLNGRWRYLDGAVKSIAKAGQQTSLGKNAPCSCGSGKKFKRCCGKS